MGTTFVIVGFLIALIVAPIKVLTDEQKPQDDQIKISWTPTWVGALMVFCGLLRLNGFI